MPRRTLKEVEADLLAANRQITKLQAEIDAAPEFVRSAVQNATWVSESARDAEYNKRIEHTRCLALILHQAGGRVEIPLMKDFNFNDEPVIVSRAQRDGTKIVYLVTPERSAEQMAFNAAFPPVVPPTAEVDTKKKRR